MSEQFETLFKNLAKGMSRRAALGRFFGGIAGAAAFALMGRPVRADKNDCGKFCAKSFHTQEPDNGWVRACMQASETCPEGFCARPTLISYDSTVNRDEPGEHLNFEEFVCVPAG